VSPPFRRYEPNPQIDSVFEVDGATAAQVHDAKPPPIWATEPATAHYQFTAFAKRLRAIAPGASARLRATNVAFDRPVFVAVLDRGKITTPLVARSNPDANDRYVFTVHGSDASAFDHAWVVTDGKQEPVKYEHGTASIQPLVSGLEVLILCNERTCIIGDAFISRF